MEILSSFQGTSGLFKKAELNWGVLGTARIAEQKVIPAIKNTKNNYVVAIASRDLARAEEFAKRNEIARAYGSYEELLADPDVHAVYIPLPNSEHCPWAIRAMEAGKQVLVEKSIALNADEAQLMVDTAKDKSVLLMEAFMYRYHSRFNKILDMVQKGDIGKLRFIQSSFSFQLSNPDDIRLIGDLGGGALLDIGTYCVNFQRLLVGREPKAAQALCYRGSTGVDLQMTVTLDFGESVFGHFDVAFNAVGQQSTHIVGSEGTLNIVSPFNTNNESTHAVLSKGSSVKKISFRAENEYERMITHFYYVLVNREAPFFPLADAVKNMAVIDMINQAVGAGGAMEPNALMPVTSSEPEPLVEADLAVSQAEWIELPEGEASDAMGEPEQDQSEQE